MVAIIVGSLALELAVDPSALETVAVRPQVRPVAVPFVPLVVPLVPVAASKPLLSIILRLISEPLSLVHVPVGHSLGAVLVHLAVLPVAHVLVP